MGKKNYIFKSGEPPTGEDLKNFYDRIEEEQDQIIRLKENLEKLREKGTGIPLKMPMPKVKQQPSPKPRKRQRQQPTPTLPKPRQRQRPTPPPTQMAYGGGKVVYRKINGKVLDGNEITGMIYKND